MGQDNTPAPHPTADQLRDFNYGRLDDAAALAVGEHLEGCPACCRALAGLPAVDEFVGQVRAAADSGGPAQRGAAQFPRQVGDYTLLREVGRGGMGVVYEAEQLSLGRRVALKVLHVRGLTGAAALGRFRREARLAARLHHTNIVPVFEFGQDGDVCFYAMQYIPGQSLDRVVDHLRRGRPGGGALSRIARTFGAGSEALSRGDTVCTRRPEPPDAPAPVTEVSGPRAGLGYQAVARVGLQAAQALAYAHERGVLHRDVKPSNLLLDEPGVVWVTDFGLAKGEDDGLTGSGDFLGTLRYMAPERFRGSCDARADVYGLGLTLYELLVLRPAFPASEHARLLDEIHYREPPRPRALDPHVPADLETVVLTAMDKDPARRYQTAAEMADDLGRFLAGTPIRARRAGAWERAWKWARRRPAVAALLLLLLVVFLAGGAASAWFAVEAGRRARDAEEAEGRARRSADERQEALVAARQRAAELKFLAGLEECQSGAVQRGLFTLLEAWRSAPPEAAEFRRVVRTNFAAWGRQLPSLQCAVQLPERTEVMVQADANGEAFFAWARGSARLQRWGAVTGAPEGPPSPLPRGEPVEDVSPDGRLVSTRTGQQLSLVRDLRTGRPFAGPVEHPDELGEGRPASPLRFVPGGRVAVSCDPLAGRQHFWLLGEGGGPALSLSLGFWDCYHVTRDREGRDVLVVFRRRREAAGAASHAEAWDLAARRLLGALVPPADGDDPRFGWGGRSLLSLSGDLDWFGLTRARGDSAVRPWAPATGQEQHEAWRPRREAQCATLSADSQVLVTCGGDQRGRLFDLATGLQRGGDLPALVERWRTKSRRLAVFADGERLVVGGDDGSARLWRARGTLQLSAAASPRDEVAAGRVEFGPAVLSPDGRTALVAPPRGLLSDGFLLDVASGQLRGPPLALPHAANPCLSPDGRLAALGDYEQSGRSTFRVWEADTGRPRTPPLTNPKLIHGLAFSPDGGTLAVAGVGGTFLWDVAGARPRAYLHEGTASYGLLFRADGRRLAVASTAGWTAVGAGFRLWDPAAGKPVGPFVPTPMPDRAKALWFAFAEGGRSLRVFDAHNGRLHTRDAETGRATGGPLDLHPAERAAFSRDCSRLATCYGSGTVREWDAATGRPLGTQMSTPSPALSLHYSPDGRTLAAACKDHAIRLWDTATHLPLGPPLLHRHRLTGVAFTADGRALVALTAAGGAYTWPLAEPFPEGPDRAELWLQTTGGVGLRGGEVTLLAPAEWAAKKRQLGEGLPPAGEEEGAGAAAWHDRRARDAEEAGNTFAALWHLERLAALRPGDWRVPARRARALGDAGDRARAEAAYKQAAARRGGAALLDWYRQRAATLRWLEDWQGVLWYQDRLAAAGAADWRLYAARAETHGKLGHAAEREADLARAVEAGAGAAFLASVADGAAAQGRWQRAAELFGRAAAQGPVSLGLSLRLGQAQLAGGDTVGYQRTCAGLLRELGPALGKLPPEVVNNVAWAVALGPGGAPDYGPLVQGLERIAAREGQGKQRHVYLNTLGAVLYRAGRHREALARLEEGVAANGGKGGPADWALMALAHHALGNAAKAREYLARVPAYRPEGGKFSWDSVEVEVLRREAAAFTP
jgi:serine/threonine protein kinase/WD40 repeat protein